MGELKVIVPADTAAGYRLAGVTTLVTESSQEAHRLVQDAMTAVTDDVIGVDSRLWRAIPDRVRQEWQRRSVPLVVMLPGSEGEAAADRTAALRDLLAHSVGYEITFNEEGPTS